MTVIALCFLMESGHRQYYTFDAGLMAEAAGGHSHSITLRMVVSFRARIGSWSIRETLKYAVIRSSRVDPRHGR